MICRDFDPAALIERAFMSPVHLPAGSDPLTDAVARALDSDADRARDGWSALGNEVRLDASTQALFRLVAALMARARVCERAPEATRCSQDPVLEVWLGLLAGTWCLVDDVEHGEEQLVLAYQRRRASTLPLRQRQVLFFAAAGWSNQEIGYALELSESTVAVHLGRAMTAAGLRSRNQWMRLSWAASEPRGDRSPESDTQSHVT